MPHIDYPIQPGSLIQFVHDGRLVPGTVVSHEIERIGQIEDEVLVVETTHTMIFHGERIPGVQILRNGPVLVTEAAEPTAPAEETPAEHPTDGFNVMRQVFELLNDDRPDLAENLLTGTGIALPKKWNRARRNKFYAEGWKAGAADALGQIRTDLASRASDTYGVEL